MEPGKTDQDIQIPVLKKEEKERKGAGIPLPSAAAAGKTAVGGGLMGLLSGKIGAGVLVCALGGAGLVGYGALQQGKVRPAGLAPQLAAPEMAVRVPVRDSQGSRSLSYMAQTGSGQLKWDDPNAVRPKGAQAEDAKPDEAKPEGDETDAAKAAEEMPKAPDQFSDAQKLGGLSGAKLSSSLGGGFGKGNIFANGGGFKPKGSQLDPKLQNLADFRKKSGAGKLGGLSRGKQMLLAKRIGTQNVSANKAMGQLKYSGSRSQEAAKLGATEAGSTYAADAFQGQSSEAGSAPGAPGVSGGVADPMGGGAPDITGSTNDTPDVGPGENVTPYQPQVDNAKQLTDTAKSLLIAGIALVTVGLAIMAAASWTGIGAVIGGIIAGIGAALMVVAMMLHSQARQMGGQIGDNYGQEEQEHIINRQATNSGNRAYTDHDHAMSQHDNTVHEDTEKESNSTYNVR